MSIVWYFTEFGEENCLDPALFGGRFPQHRFLSNPKITWVLSTNHTWGNDLCHSVFVTFEFDNLSMSALVSVLPELVAESDPKEALKQVALPSSAC